MSLFEVTMTAGANGSGPGAPTDWAAFRASVLAKLDVVEEYRALGIEFTKAGPNAKGLVECRAVGRVDNEPSAFVNVETGVYHDSGGEGETLDLFQFALRHCGGRWGRWIDVARHYAEKAGVPIGNVSYSSKGKILETIYSYHDDQDQLIFGVHRYRLPNGDKTFRQYPWKQGDWYKAEGCMDGVPLYPYRLPEILKAEPDVPIWIVEGEKDADRLRAIGFVATCNPMGALKWNDSYSVWLKDRPCYIVPDNDPIGRQHAERVAQSLSGKAKLLKVVTLPDLGIHGDVSDWLDAGATFETLGRIAYNAPAWTPNVDVAQDDLTRDATVADIRRTQTQESWTWPLYIPNSSLTLLAAEAGTGKTRFCFDLCRRMYHHLEWPDGAMIAAPPGGKFLWVVADNQWQEMCDISASFAIPDEAVILNSPASDPYSGTSLQSEEELADFEARIRRVRPALVIIDTITNTSDYKVEVANDAKRQYKPLQEIATRCQVPIVCVTHLNAGGKVLGRRAVEKVRVVIQMERPDPEGQPNRRRLWVSKSKAIMPPALGVTMGSEGNEYDDQPPAAAEPEQANGAPRNGARNNGPPPVKIAACMAWLEVHLGLGRTRVSRVRTAAEQEGYTAGTLYKAKDRLGIVEIEVDGYKFWELRECVNAVNPNAPF